MPGPARRTTARRLGVAAAVTLAASPLAACGGGSSDAGGLSASAFLTTFRTAIATSSTARLGFESDSASGTISGLGVEEVSDGVVRARLVVHAGDNQLPSTVLVDGDDVYVMPEEGSYSRSDHEQALGVAGSYVLDPSFPVQLLQQAGTRVTDLGTTTLDGGPSHGYEIVGGQPAVGLGGEVDSEAVYLDGSGQLHQIVIKAADVTSTVTYSQLGAPAEVPAPSDVLPSGS